RVQGDELVLATGQRGVDTDSHGPYYPLLTERQQNGGHRQDALGATKGTQSIGGGCLDRDLADWAAQHVGQCLAHRLTKRRQTRLASDDREIGVFELPVLVRKVLPDVAQQFGAARTAPARVGRGKPIADVAAAS